MSLITDFTRYSNMKKLFCVWLLFSIASCKKKDVVVDETAVQTINFDLPLVRGRNLDSLKVQKYDERILAFSIELGYRSTDFNKRLGLIISAKTPNDDWKILVKSIIRRENYQTAERTNRQYLDSLSLMIVRPPTRYVKSHEELTRAFRRLISNYEILKEPDQFKNLPALLDSVLSNELTINESLKNFEQQIKNSQAL